MTNDHSGEQGRENEPDLAHRESAYRSATGSGLLYLVPTPIGNLGDLSPRAIEVMSQAALLCCEDTRRTRGLLTHAGIRATALTICNEHTEERVADRVISMLATGASVALVTDAGTPAMSDPGEHLVRAVLAAGYEVSALPGPFAGVTALVASGLPTDRFAFEGFLARKGSDRAEQLSRVAASPHTVIIYEAPHRIQRTLNDLLTICGPEREVVVARELTKMFEQYHRGRLGDIQIGEPRGEYVILLHGASKTAPEITDIQIRGELSEYLTTGLSTRDAVNAVVAEHRLPHRRIYTLALEVTASMGTAHHDGSQQP
jgi:16S rRNA (cytidine1402-2'-O)-methyltransferase